MIHFPVDSRLTYYGHAPIMEDPFKKFIDLIDRFVVTAVKWSMLIDPHVQIPTAYNPLQILSLYFVSQNINKSNPS